MQTIMAKRQDLARVESCASSLHCSAPPAVGCFASMKFNHNAAGGLVRARAQDQARPGRSNIDCLESLAENTCLDVILAAWSLRCLRDASTCTPKALPHPPATPSASMSSETNHARCCFAYLKLQLFLQGPAGSRGSERHSSDLQISLICHLLATSGWHRPPVNGPSVAPHDSFCTCAD
ncbi:hypothetical protein CC80DRAFT_594240 [Byssothecium circinans]|uniref:Uncharacterized protein n=1 Tax=Byssothecium circinans TaxID=147558 RepID=A0A6A5TU08_9PLEO|nr:hypothetical protein CC80DRAFT_594240 [Byssothecium circinans]